MPLGRFKSIKYIAPSQFSEFLNELNKSTFIKSHSLFLNDLYNFPSHIATMLCLLSEIGLFSKSVQKSDVSRFPSSETLILRLQKTFLGYRYIPLY